MFARSVLVSLIIFLGAKNFIKDCSDLELPTLYHLSGETLHIIFRELELFRNFILVLDTEPFIEVIPYLKRESVYVEEEGGVLRDRKRAVYDDHLVFFCEEDLLHLADSVSD